MDIIMPQLGETVEEGMIGEWLKSVGDKVAKGDLLFEVETDKVTTEIPATVDGTLTKIMVEAGETVLVGTPLAILQVDGEEVSEVKAEDTASISDEKEPVSKDATPAAKVIAVGRDDVRGPRLSPVVRRLVAKHALNVEDIKGTGAANRITKKDIECHLGSLKDAGSVKRTATPAPSGPAKVATHVTVVPFNRIRQKTAERMVLSKTTSPHVFQGVEVCFGNIEKVRVAHKAGWKKRHGFSLTYLPFIVRAAAIALKEFPNLNAHLYGGELHVQGAVNIGIAVDLDFNGLIVPVVKNADTQTVSGLALSIRDLSDRARSGSLKVDDLSEATYTISNSGSFGTMFTAPIINQPQVAIMSTDGVKKKPVVVENDDGDSIAIRPVGIVAQSFDHRAIDGAYSAAFLRRVNEIIETHDWAAEL